MPTYNNIRALLSPSNLTITTLVSITVFNQI